MVDAYDVLNTIKVMIRPEYLKGSTMSIKENISGYYSIVVSSQKTAYRVSDTTDLLMARIWNIKGTGFVSFPSKYSAQLQVAGIEYSIVKSEPNFVRFDVAAFSPLSGNLEKLSKVVNQIFIELFSFSAFGCCSSYNECSNALHCVHPDPAYATACQYRKNLEAGRVFYGVNKNI